MGKISINSVSGGKSSAYIAANYPSDVEIFSLVCCDEPKLAHPDKKLMQAANDRLSKYCPHWGEFIGTTEDYTIIQTIFDLEQFIGREIIWVRGESFDSIIERKSMIPNKLTRICTTEMKMRPIFEYVFKYFDLQPQAIPTPKHSKERPFECLNPVEMKIGYRYDEAHRRDTFTTDFQIATQSSVRGERKMRNKIFKNWRVGAFPLVDDLRHIYHILSYWKDKGVVFSEESNCNNCYWKTWQRLQQLYRKNPALADWTSAKEDLIGHTFNSDFSVKQILNLPTQLGVFDVGMVCASGNCHD